MTRKDVRPAGVVMEEPPLPSQDDAEASIQRPLLMLVAGLAGLSWIAILAALALSFANPVTFNLAQLRVADTVAHVRVVDPESGKCEVLDTLKGDALPATITVANLKQTAAQAGGEYLIPLSRQASGQLVVTPAPLPKSNLLIYPFEGEDSQVEPPLREILAPPEAE